MANSRKKAKSYRNKRGLRVLYLVLSFVLIVAAVIVGSVLFFQVESVEVSGSTKYSNEQILGVASVDQNANLLLLPEAAISKRIMDSLPYVDGVKLQRSFPTTLKIIIRESVPLASVNAEGAWYILDANGKVLERTEESIASGYIQLAGLSLKEPKVGEAAQVEAAQAARLKGLRGLLTSLQEKDMAKNVQWIDLSRDTEIEMGYLGKFTVRLPISTKCDDKVSGNEEYKRQIETLQQIISLLDQTDRGIIDLRQENGYFRPR